MTLTSFVRRLLLSLTLASLFYALGLWGQTTDPNPWGVIKDEPPRSLKHYTRDIIRPDSVRLMPTGEITSNGVISINEAMLATPESSANAIATDRASQARGTARFQAANETAEEDAVFALEAIVTRHGRLVGLDRLRATHHKATGDEVKLIEGLLDRVERARIEPDYADGEQTPANGMVWLVTRTTVRATKTVAVDLALPPPAAKKRTASLRDRAESITL